MARQRPSLASPCVADRYHGPRERIGEFSAATLDAGGLIALREVDGADKLRVELYRLEGCEVVLDPATLDPRTLAAAAKLHAERTAAASPPELPHGYSVSQSTWDDGAGETGVSWLAFDPQGERAPDDYGSRHAAILASRAHAAGEGWPLG